MVRKKCLVKQSICKSLEELKLIKYNEGFENNSAFGSTEDLALFWLHCSEMPGLSLLCTVVSAEVLSWGGWWGITKWGFFPCTFLIGPECSVCMLHTLIVYSSVRIYFYLCVLISIFNFHF